jgi:hypothetical protein
MICKDPVATSAKPGAFWQTCFGRFNLSTRIRSSCGLSMDRSCLFTLGDSIGGDPDADVLLARVFFNELKPPIVGAHEAVNRLLPSACGDAVVGPAGDDPIPE